MQCTKCTKMQIFEQKETNQQKRAEPVKRNKYTAGKLFCVQDRTLLIVLCVKDSIQETSCVGSRIVADFDGSVSL